MKRTKGKLASYAEIRLNEVRQDKAALFSLIVCLALFALIVYSIVIRIQMLSLGTSLWNDEALLAENIVGKSMGQILTPPLSNLPTTSAFYLIAVKAFVHLFGTAEWVLRLYSFIALVLLLIVQGVVLRKVYRASMVFVFFSVALTSVFYYYMDYSAEVKPYMGDALFSVLVILLYWLYRRGRIGPVLLGAFLSVCLSFSTPAAFFAAGVILTEFAVALLRRDKRSALRIVLAGVIVLAVFIVNYLLWLRPISDVPDLVWYWHNRRFDFHFWNAEALSHDAKIIADLFQPLNGGFKYLTIVLAVCGVIVTVVKRNIYTLSLLVSFLLLLIAAAVEKYPLMNRLWMFVFVWIFIFAFVFLSSLRLRISGERKERITTIIVTLIIAVVLLIPNYKFADYGKGAEWTLVPGNQANPLIEYV
ncbi:MAG: hypothetical protein FWF33_03860, partial [Clostridiales bacterium]|nr:hypothetical protein [Clostridiales bacterium]